MQGEQDGRHSESVVLVAYGGIGALMAIALLAILAATGEASLHPAPAAAPGASSAFGETAPAGCPLKTTAPMCDACMQERCRQSCADCAGDPDCIALFLCVLDCREPACSHACSDRYPHATQTLEAFAGENGCMRKCRDACR